MVPGGSVLASCPKTGTATDDAAAAAAARRKLRRSICVSSCACFFGGQRVISRQPPNKPGRRRLAAEAKAGPDFATDFRNGKAKSVQWARPAGNDIIFVEGHYHSRLGDTQSTRRVAEWVRRHQPDYGERFRASAHLRS